MSDVTGPPPAEPDGVPALLAAVRSFSAQVVELTSDIEELPTRFALRKDVEDRARRTRKVLIVGAVVILAVLGLVGGFHSEAVQRERDRAKDRAAVAAAQAATDRANLLAGCERGNDQRATLRAVIDRAVAATPPPDGLPADLAELYRQAQERTAALRADLLALPGVQPVDCAAAFPAPDPKALAR